MKNVVSIKRVAAEANVSAMTVSRVLNHPESVSPETRNRVLEVIARLGYRPNAIARSLKLQRTHTIGLITGGLDNWFYVQMSLGAVRELRKHNYRVLLSTTDRDPDGEPDFMHMLAENRVDGVLLAHDTVEKADDPLVQLLRVDLPIVTTGYRLSRPAFRVVDVDNVEGAQQVMRYLIAQGHRRIAMITGAAIYKAAQDRIEGYRRTLAEAGLPFDPALICEGRWTIDSGYASMRDLLTSGASFTAVFAHNDEMAIGAMRALREAGLNVPQDVSVVGFDDTQIAQYVDPPLTSVHQPVSAIGVIAARLLVRMLDDPNQPLEDELVKTTLVVRDSVAAPRTFIHAPVR